MAGYILDQTWELEAERLEALQQSCDPVTIEHLRGAGVGAGWQCLEVGAGRGSIARWLADRVGEGGWVLAVDLDTTLLEEHRDDVLEVRRLDILRDPLPQDRFDLVHARHVLGHLAERTAALRRLVTALRPGGVMLVEDFDWRWTQHGEWPCDLVEHGELVSRVWAAALEVMRAGSYDATWGARLPSALRAAGLVEVRGEVRAVIGDGDFARCMYLTIVRFRDRIADAGFCAEGVDRCLELLADPSNCVTAPLTFSVWGRRPL